MNEHRLLLPLFEHADALGRCAPALAPVLSEAASLLVHGFTAGAKVLVAGDAASRPWADHLVQCLVEGLERPRPPLGAVALHAPVQGRQPAGLAMARRLQCLGQSGDVLWLLGTDTGTDDFLEVVHAAHDHDLAILALTGPAPGDWVQALHDTDVWIGLDRPHLPALLEMQLTVVHALCRAVDSELLGDDE
jgi:D-sedoheptulose 7-phosphate isomerase